MHERGKTATDAAASSMQHHAVTTGTVKTFKNR